MGIHTSATIVADMSEAHIHIYKFQNFLSGEFYQRFFKFCDMIGDFRSSLELIYEKCCHMKIPKSTKCHLISRNFPPSTVKNAFSKDKNIYCKKCQMLSKLRQKAEDLCIKIDGCNVSLHVVK